MAGLAESETAWLERRLLRAEESRTWCLRLVSVLIHEISQPLTVLAGEIQLALRDHHPEAEYREVLEGCAIQTEHLSQLVERLRDLAWAEQGAEVTGEVRMLEVARQSIQSIRPLAGPKQITFALEAEGDPEVAAPPGNLKRVLHEVLKSAVERSPRDREVRITVEASPPVVTCRVIDHGSALSPEDVARLLDPFTRDPGRQPVRFVDRSLEWCLAKRMTEAWGGSFGVESGPKGCSVSFTVPVWTPGAPRASRR
jgi:signal transduction histidine kinase